jgi:sterol desaturase/sphingolipid hydroxylase (fatty acid hydroxylase superfamily)
MQAINLMYQFWLHTDLVRRLGPLERVPNTPSHHRLDRDCSGILSVWDGRFRTFAREDPQTPIVYGCWCIRSAASTCSPS